MKRVWFSSFCLNRLAMGCAGGILRSKGRQSKLSYPTTEKDLEVAQPIRFRDLKAVCAASRRDCVLALPHFPDSLQSSQSLQSLHSSQSCGSSEYLQPVQSPKYQFRSLLQVVYNGPISVTPCSSGKPPGENMAEQ